MGGRAALTEQEVASLPIVAATDHGEAAHKVTADMKATTRDAIGRNKGTCGQLANLLTSMMSKRRQH